MSLKFAAAVAVALANQITTLIDAGASTSNLVIYDGAEPTDGDTALGAQTALVTFALPDPSFGAASDSAGGGKITANAIDPVNAAADGTATWFRIYDGDGNTRLQGSVSDTIGDGDLKLSATNIVTGVEVSVVSLIYTQRKA